MPETPTPAPEATFRLKPDVRYRVIDGEALILRQEAAEVLGLNDIGSRLLEWIAAGTAAGELPERLAAEYEAEPAEVEHDVAAFVAELLAEGVLEEIQADGENRD